MPATTHSRNQDAKAERLINDGRCHELTSIPGKLWTGVIEGDTSCYLVTDVDSDALPKLGTGPGVPRSSCGCTAFVHTRACAHTLAAFKLRIRSTPVDEIFAQLGA